jgi:hypothetical protein
MGILLARHPLLVLGQACQGRADILASAIREREGTWYRVYINT